MPTAGEIMAALLGGAGAIADPRVAYGASAAIDDITRAEARKRAIAAATAKDQLALQREALMGEMLKRNAPGNPYEKQITDLVGAGAVGEAYNLYASGLRESEAERRRAADEEKAAMIDAAKGMSKIVNAPPPSYESFTQKNDQGTWRVWVNPSTGAEARRVLIDPPSAQTVRNPSYDEYNLKDASGAVYHVVADKDTGKELRRVQISPPDQVQPKKGGLGNYRVKGDDVEYITPEGNVEYYTRGDVQAYREEHKQGNRLPSFAEALAGMSESNFAARELPPPPPPAERIIKGKDGTMLISRNGGAWEPYTPPAPPPPLLSRVANSVSQGRVPGIGRR